MEVNNNDPNNNDVVILDRMDEPVVDQNMGLVGGRSIPRPDIEDEDGSEPQHSDSSVSNRSFYLERTMKSRRKPYFYESDYLSDDYGEDSHDSMAEDLEDMPQEEPWYGMSDNNLSSDNSDVESNGEWNDDSNEEMENDDSVIALDASGQPEPNETIPDEEIEELPPVLPLVPPEKPKPSMSTESITAGMREGVPSTSKCMDTLSDDYHIIKRIAPNLSDNLIFKYLHRNEDHDNRLMASVWDLMHAINRPRSRQEKLKPKRNILKSNRGRPKKIHKETQAIPVPGNPSVYTVGNVKMPVPPSQSTVSNWENRKDYTRVPKRASQAVGLPDSEDKSKRPKLSEPITSVMAQDGSGPSTAVTSSGIATPGKPNVQAKVSSPILAPAKLTVLDPNPQAKSLSVVPLQELMPLPPVVAEPSLTQAIRMAVKEAQKVSNNMMEAVKEAQKASLTAAKETQKASFTMQDVVKEAQKTFSAAKEAQKATYVGKVQVIPKEAVQEAQKIFAGKVQVIQNIDPNKRYINKPWKTLEDVEAKPRDMYQYQWRSPQNNPLPTLPRPSATHSKSTDALKRHSEGSTPHVKVSSKQLAGYLISACQNSGVNPAAPIIKPATLTLPPMPTQVVQMEAGFNGASTSGASTSSTNASPMVMSVSVESNFAADANDFSERELAVDVHVEIEKLQSKDVFNQLTAMFEKVRREYIVLLCQKYEPIMRQQDMMNHLIDVLLVKGHNYEKRTVVEDMQKVSLQEKYNDLMEIFPDADPEYLRIHASKYIDNPEQFKEFVQANLESKNYPTKEEYLRKQKIKKQLDKYITNFDVVQFLEMFPNPFKHFLNPKRSSDPDLSLNYLKWNYNKIDTIQRMFRKCNQNLSLTVEQLDIIKVDMKSRRHMQPASTDNLLFAQEMAFIRHRKEIKAYLSEKEANEKREFKMLKKRGALLECQCCFNDECVPSKSSYCENGHVFCYSCIIRGTEMKMADGETHVKCFADCDSELPLSVLQKVLPPAKFSILLTKRQEAEVKAAGLEGLVSCPFCHFASIPPAEDKVFKCLNQECMKESCRSCKELNHVPLACEEAKATDKARHFLEEQMTDALIRICYNCKKPFFKEEGCNKMTCTCKATMCYICGQPVKDYGHFRGQGSDALNLCPLYTDDALLNATVVRRVAEKTAKSLMEKDPNVKLEAEKLMPVLPQPKRGPHSTIVHPLNLPEHALRARPYNDHQ